MPSRTQCNPNPVSQPSPSTAGPDSSSGKTPRPHRWPIQRSLPSMPRAVRERKPPQRTWEEGPYSLRRARVVLDEMANYLCFVRDRLEAHAELFPVSPHREAQLAFERPYEVSTEIWQVATEAEVQLSDLIDRMKAAAWVTQAALDEEFEELAEAAG
jgi:hypothetical protein